MLGLPSMPCCELAPRGGKGRRELSTTVMQRFLARKDFYLYCKGARQGNWCNVLICMGKNRVNRLDTHVENEGRRAVAP